jgi:hypothetical protein
MCADDEWGVAELFTSKLDLAVHVVELLAALLRVDEVVRVSRPLNPPPPLMVDARLNPYDNEVDQGTSSDDGED